MKKHLKEQVELNPYEIRLNLNYEVYYEIDFEQSLIKLLFDILNWASILFGFNVFSLLSILRMKINFKYFYLFIY